MASIQRRGSTFRARWYVGTKDGKKVYDSKGGFITRSAAVAHAAEQEELIARGIDTQTAKQAWGAWRDEWQASRIIETSTANSQRPVLAKWISPHWEHVPLDQITRQEVLKWVAKLAKTAPSGQTVAKAFWIFSGSLTAAVDASILPANPAHGVKLPTLAQGGERAYTDEECEAILAALPAPSRERIAVMIMLEAGLRPGEVAGLHRPRVNLDRRVIEVVEAWEDEGRYLKAYPKGRKKRHVPISDRLADELKLWFEADPQPAATCGLAHREGRCRGPLVVTGAQGGALNLSNMRNRQWAQALKAAGLEYGKIYWLRHTFATRQAIAGTSMQALAAVLGHSTIVVTARYSHLGNAHHEQVLAAMNVNRTDVRMTKGMTTGHLALVPDLS